MLILSHNDLVKAGCFNIPNAFEVIENTLKQYGRGEIAFPDKISQIFNEETQDRINCLPATLLPQKVCGVKWVAVFPQNPILHNLPNLNASILLSELKTGYPIAFMDGTLCSDLRTATISAVAAKYLANPDAEKIGFIGSGEQAKMHFLTLKHVLPNIKQCRVASRRHTSEILFIEQLSKLCPDVEFIACDSNYEKSAREADVIVTAVSCQSPILQAKWLKKGVFYSHVGGWEDAYDVPLSMNKIVCDDWNAVKHRTQTISRLYKAGKLTDKDIYSDLYEIVSGNKPGRESADEKIYFNAVGLSYLDVALALSFYNRAAILDVPQLRMYQKSIFDTQMNDILL
ncbi:MAG: ornithine cyclodeaminase family protein [Akkermansia sp.]|nr:ornithine cyclodeaminase family protein [Akkermansia sp.]